VAFPPPAGAARRVWVLIVVLIVAAAGVSWYFSSKIVAPDHSSWPADVTVEGVAPGRVTIDRFGDPARPGVYGVD